jgi:pimeloyl-ACP methyl ester carboxylesterase
MVREQLAAAGITAAHLVGNSLDGAVALMLAEAGAARSVTAFSPAGGWRGRREFHRLALLLRAARLAMGLPCAGGMLAVPAVGVLLLRAVMNRPGKLGRDEFAELTADLRGCTVVRPLLDEARRSGPMKPALNAAIPVRIAWPDRDRTIGFSSYGAPLLDHLPQAEVVRLAGVGHVPMYDDPALIATVITEFVDAAERPNSARLPTVPKDTKAETGGARA